MPLENSRVIPAGWEAHHRPVAEATFTARCRITRTGAGQGTWNESRKQYDPPARVTVYETLPCRVQQLTLPNVYDTALQKVSTHDYRVSVPIAVAAVLIDDWIEIVGGDDTLDQTLLDPDRHLVITDVQRGSLMWERDLIAIDNLG